MNKIVRTQGPASDLPERYRGDIDPSQTVDVTVEEATTKRPLRTMREIMREAPSGDVTMEDAVGRIRNLRDEWDD